MIAITIISVLLELLLNIKFFTCEISSSKPVALVFSATTKKTNRRFLSKGDFNHPLEKLAAAGLLRFSHVIKAVLNLTNPDIIFTTGDYYPIDFKVWDPKEPEPKCALLVYWSDQCGFHSGSGWIDDDKARKCTHGGQLVRKYS